MKIMIINNDQNNDNNDNTDNNDHDDDDDDDDDDDVDIADDAKVSEPFQFPPRKCLKSDDSREPLRCPASCFCLSGL